MKTLIGAACAALLLPCAANAAVVVTVAQDGANVVATASGTLNTTGLTFYGNMAVGSVLRGTEGGVIVGTQRVVQAFYGFTGPASFGPGTTQRSATSGTGASFGVFNLSEFSFILLPTGFVSGGAINATATFNNATVSGLGLTDGTYLFALPNDTIAVNIDSTPAVPEPATWGMMLLGFGALGHTMRRRARSGSGVGTRVRFA